MKKTLLLALVLIPLTLSFTGCAGKRMKRLEAELISCRESRTKLIQQQRSELDTPADGAIAEDEAVETHPSAPTERALGVAIATRDEDHCSPSSSTPEPL